jgi:plasmid replication initiation protein
MVMVTAEAKKARKITKQKKGVIRAKSDFFRTARYGLTLSEHRIIYITLLMGQQNGTPFEPQELAIKDFKELCELKGESSYSVVRERSGKLVSKYVEIVYKDDTGSSHLFQGTWLSSVDYHPKKGTITLTPNKQLQPFFEGKPFTDTEFYYLIKFNSQYAERLYEILKTFDHKSIVDFSIDDLRTRLAIPETKYPNYAHLRQYVLARAVSDICEYTDLDVCIREKRGLHNKVEFVLFIISKKTIPKLAERVANGEYPVALSDEEQSLLMDGQGEEIED